MVAIKLIWEIIEVGNAEKNLTRYKTKAFIYSDIVRERAMLNN